MNYQFVLINITQNNQICSALRECINLTLMYVSDDMYKGMIKICEDRNEQKKL